MLSVRHLVTSLVLVVGAVLAGCSHGPKTAKPAGPGIGGTVIYITNAKLPDDATVELKLVELDREGRVDRVVATESYPRPASVPMEYWLPYQPGLISQRQAYGIEGVILSGGKTLFATPRPVPVLTKGNPTRAEIVVTPVRP